MAELNEFFLLQKDKLSFSASIGGGEGKVRDIHKAVFEEGFMYYDLIANEARASSLVLGSGKVEIKDFAVAKLLSTAFYKVKGEEYKFLKRQAGKRAVEYLDELESELREKLIETRIEKLKLIYRMTQWKELKSSALDALKKIDKKNKSFLFYLSCAYWKLGDFKKADETFKKIPGRLPKSQQTQQDIFYKELRSKSGASEAFASYKIGDALLRKEKDDFCRLVVGYYASYDLELPVNIASCVFELLKELEEKVSLKESVSPKDIEVDCRNIVFSCGFAYSGSGAVSDYLLGYKGVASPVKGEVAWTQGRNMGSISQVLREEVFSCYEFYRFILSGFLGVSISPEISDGQVVGFSSHRSKKIGSNVDRFVLMNSAVGMAASADVANQPFIIEFVKGCKGERCNGLANRMILFCKEWAFAMSKSSYVVMNNAFMAPLFNSLRYFHGAKAVVVLRDPRDQYCARSSEANGGAPGGSDEFLSHIHRSYSSFEKAYVKNDVDALCVRFEDFVAYASVQNDVLNFCFDGQIPERADGGYKPSDSLHNIGIHKVWSNQNEILSIEKAIQRGDVAYPEGFKDTFV